MADSEEWVCHCTLFWVTLELPELKLADKLPTSGIGRGAVYV